MVNSSTNINNIIDEFVESKGIIRIRKSKNRQHNSQKKNRQHNSQKEKNRQHNSQKEKNRQHNSQKEKNRQHNSEKERDKRTNNDLQNITQNTKKLHRPLPLKKTFTDHFHQKKP